MLWLDKCFFSVLKSVLLKYLKHYDNEYSRMRCSGALVVHNILVDSEPMI